MDTLKFIVGPLITLILAIISIAKIYGMLSAKVESNEKRIDKLVTWKETMGTWNKGTHDELCGLKIGAIRSDMQSIKEDIKEDITELKRDIRELPDRIFAIIKQNGYTFMKPYGKDKT